MQRLSEYDRFALEDRLRAHVSRNWSQRCERIEIRIRGAYAYIEAVPTDEWTLPGYTEQELEVLRQTPLKLCRLTWTGDPDSWGFAFYTYSNERYEPSLLFDGSFTGTPEACFDCAAQLYLQ